jgi:hypothetical protein
VRVGLPVTQLLFGAVIAAEHNVSAAGKEGL